MRSSLLETNKSAYQYCEMIQEQLKQIYSPLLQLEIDYFGHLKIFNDGSFLSISNIIDFERDFLFKDEDFGSIFLEVYSKVNQQKYFLTPYDHMSIDKDRTIGLLAAYKVWDVFSIYKNINGCLHVYYFGSSKQSSMPYQLYLNNTPILEHFINYFNEKAKDIIDTTDKTKLACFNQKVNFDTNKENKFDEIINKFLCETRTKQQTLKGTNGVFIVTPREIECLYHLSQEKTCKEIAQSLRLSPRTVEYYLNNIKEKSGYKTRARLITQFNESPLSLDIQRCNENIKCPI